MASRERRIANMGGSFQQIENNSKISTVINQDITVRKGSISGSSAIADLPCGYATRPSESHCSTFVDIPIVQAVCVRNSVVFIAGKMLYVAGGDRHLQSKTTYAELTTS